MKTKICTCLPQFFDEDGLRASPVVAISMFDVAENKRQHFLFVSWCFVPSCERIVNAYSKSLCKRFDYGSSCRSQRCAHGSIPSTGILFGTHVSLRYFSLLTSSDAVC